MARTKKTSPTLKKKGTEKTKGTIQKKREENEVETGTGPGLVFEGETDKGEDWSVEASPFGSVEASIEVAWEGNGELYLVAGVDLSPVDLDVGYNPETGELGLGGAVGVPGDLLGVGGGFTIDTNTGEIIGVSGSVAVAGLEIDLEVSGPGGCRKTFTMTYFGVGVSNVIDECSIEPEPNPGDDDDDDENEQTTPIYPPNTWYGIACDGLSEDIEEYRKRNPNFGTYSGSYYVQFSTKTISNTIGPVQFEDGTFGSISSTKGCYGISYRHKSWSNMVGPIWSCKCRKLVQNHQAAGVYYAQKIRQYKAGSYHIYVQTPDDDKPRQVLPPPSPSTSSNSPPPPQPKMKNCNCKAILEKLDQLLNVNGGAAETQYPVIVRKTNEDGTVEEIPVYNILSYLQHKLSQGSEDVLELLTEVSLVTGKIKKDEKSPYPVKLKQVVDNKIKEFEVNNLFEFSQAMGNANGYRKDPGYPVVLKIKSQEKGQQDKEFRYGSAGELQADIGRVLAPQKMLNGNGGEGFAISKGLLIPGATGYDFTYDYPGIYTRLFSSIDNHGFSAPIVAKVQDVNAAKEGDQTVELQINSLEAAIQALLELAIENGGDIDTQTNILVRISYLLSRTFVLLSRVWHRVTAILDGIGVSTDSSVETLDVEFDPFAKREFKGFGADSPKGQLDLHEEDTTEKLLPDLLQMSKVDIAVEKAQKGDSLRQKLVQLTHKKK